MVKTYFKTFARMFKRHATRLISVFLMVVLSVGFSAGIGMATDKMKYALGEIYKKENVSDFIVRGDTDLSGKKEELGKLGFEVVLGGFIEAEEDGVPVRLYTFPTGETGKQNLFETIDEAPMPAANPAREEEVASLKEQLCAIQKQLSVKEYARSPEEEAFLEATDPPEEEGGETSAGAEYNRRKFINKR